jgi:hypothetical protein
VLGGLGVGLLLGAAPAGAAPLEPCRDDASARCGAIKLPLHRSEPGGPKLRGHFRVFPRGDRSRPALEPIVAAEGGPGYSTIESASSYRFMLGPLLARRDLIVMDNRGRGPRVRSAVHACRPARVGTYALSAPAVGGSGPRPTRTAPAPRPTTSRPFSIA